MRINYLAVVLCWATMPAIAQSVAERAEADELVFMGDEEPAMRRAFERARASLDDFLVKAKSPPAGASNFWLKVAIRNGKEVEYFWVGDFAVTSSGFTGTISNEPRVVKKVKFGQKYNFKRKDIFDWLYVVSGKERRMVGNFTMCALLTKEPPQEAEKTMKQYGLKCD